jgi:hypothetical protein
MSVSKTIILWIVAPLLAALGMMLCFFAPAVLLGFAAGIAGAEKAAMIRAVAFALSTFMAVMAWVVIGTLIAPLRPRSKTLIIFAAPFLLLVLPLIAAITTSDTGDKGVPGTVGLLLACAFILLLWQSNRSLPQN